MKHPSRSINEFKHLNFSINIKPKPDKQNKKTKKQAQSIAPSMLFDGVLEEQFKGLFGGKIVHFSFDCPENLRNAFIPLAKQKNGSACKTLQNLMAIFILKTMIEKHAFGNTLAQVLDLPIRVGEVRFEQYVQSRPRRLVEAQSLAESELKNDKWYCALLDEHVVASSLPLSNCFGCPNGSCRGFVLRKGDDGFE